MIRKSMLIINALFFFVSAFGIINGVIIVPEALAADFHVAVAAVDGDPGSLRDAVEQANANPDADTIYLAQGRYVLDLGQLVVSANLSIIGRGEKKSIIDGNHIGRVLIIHPATDVRIEKAMVTGGAVGTPDSDGLGGGIYNQGNLSLVRCSVSGNTVKEKTPSGFGGGIYNEGNLIIMGSFIRQNDNSAKLSYGGAIYNKGHMTIQKGGDIRSEVRGNTANGDMAGIGGGICSEGADARFHLENSIVAGNTAKSLVFASGGGIDTYGDSAVLTIKGSDVSGNKAHGGIGRGGGLCVNGNNAEFELDRSDVKKNIVDGAVNEEGGGLWVGFLVDYTRTDSVVQGNLPDQIFRP